MSTIAGIDGCHGGWLCVCKDLLTGTLTAHILAMIDDILTLAPRPELVMIDIPIGLTDSGPRACDLEARERLQKPRSSSVFPAPIRPVLAARSFAQACLIGVKIDGRKLSQQAWAILPKILEVDAFLQQDLSRASWVREVHPEVCFCAWNGGVAMGNRKKSRAGRIEREALVVPFYGAAYGAVRSSLPRRAFANDDLVDAFAALWTAERVAAGRAIVLPAAPPLDSVGLRMRIEA
jgi:predicted RNase H-like nuclease